MIGEIVRFIIALILLFLMLFLGKCIGQLLPIGIPDSIWGLLLLFLSLCLKIVKVQWFTPATRPMLRYMALFFLPISAGIIGQFDLLQQHLYSLVLANFLSTLLSVVAIGYLAQWLFERRA